METQMGTEPESKRNTALIVAVVVGILLVCCCGLAAVLWFTGDSIVETLDLAGTAFSLMA